MSNDPIGDLMGDLVGESSVILKYDSNVSIEKIIEESLRIEQQTNENASVSVPSVSDEPTLSKALLQS